MKANIYDQAVLEGVATSFHEGEDIQKISDFLKMKCWRTF
jgi:hypothetical protein